MTYQVKYPFQAYEANHTRWSFSKGEKIEGSEVQKTPKGFKFINQNFKEFTDDRLTQVGTDLLPLGFLSEI